MSGEYHPARTRLAAFVLDGESAPSRYTGADAVADVRTVAAGRQSGSLSEAESMDRALDRLYALSLAGVAEDREVRLVARAASVVPPDSGFGGFATLANAAGETTRSFESDKPRDYADEVDWVRSEDGVVEYVGGTPPAGTADYVLDRILEDATDPDDPADYAGAVCSVGRLVGSTLELLGETFPVVVDALDRAGEGTALRRGAALSTLKLVTSDYYANPRKRDAVTPLAGAVRDPDPLVAGHAAAALAREIRVGSGRGSDHPDRFRAGADALLDAVAVEDAGLRRTVLTWLSTVDWGSAGGTDDDAVPENARERSRAAVEHCLDDDTPLVRDRAQAILDSYDPPW